MRYRLGRHNDRIVYLQAGDGPSDSDAMLAVFFDAIDAMAIVSLLNGDEDDALWADDPLDAARPPLADRLGAGEPVSVPPPDRPLATGGIITSPAPVLVDEGGCTLSIPKPAGEPVVAPPPVDALLERVDRVGFYADRIARAEARDDHERAVRYNVLYGAETEAIRVDLGRLWAAGVAEGRRQRDAEITDLVVRLDAAQDSDEYRLALRKMIRTGEIRLPGSNSHG